VSIRDWWEKIVSFWDEGETNGQNAHWMRIYTIKEIKERFFFGDNFQSNLIVPILSHIPSLLHVPLHLTW